MAKSQPLPANTKDSMPEEEPQTDKAEPKETKPGLCQVCGAPLMILRSGSGQTAKRKAICSVVFDGGECASKIIPLTEALESAIKSVALPIASRCLHVVASVVKGTEYFTEVVFRVEDKTGLYRRVAMSAKGLKAKVVADNKIEIVRLVVWLEGELDVGLERIAKKEVTEGE